MAQIKIKFSNDFNRLSSDFERRFDDIFRISNQRISFSKRRWSPQIDVYETPDEIILLAEIAGVDQNNLEVEVGRRFVRIFGKRSETPVLKNASFKLAEIRYGAFERLLSFSVPVDMDSIAASYANGFLNIRLKKLIENRVHKIPIK